MDLPSEAQIFERGACLEDVREGKAIRGESSAEYMMGVKGDGSAVERIEGISPEHGIEEDEVGFGEVEEQARRIGRGSGGGAGGDELGEEDAVVVEGAAEELSVDLFHVENGEVATEEEGDGVLEVIASR